MRLNLGCGSDVKPDYVNVDIRQTHPSVVVKDLSKLPWDFPDDCAEEILLLDFLEHFPYANTVEILFQCFRVLRPDGTVVIQVPDATHVCRAIIQEGEYLCNKCERKTQWNPNCSGCGRERAHVSFAAVKRLFGGQDYPGNFHYTAFTRELLERAAASAGLELVGYEEEEHQWKMWNIKARFKRGPVW